MLLLVLSHRHVMRLVDQDIRGLQDGIIEQRCRDEIIGPRLLGLCAFILELGHARQLAVGSVTVHDPGQLGMFGHHGLDKEIFRVDAGRQQVDGQFPAVFPQFGRYEGHGHRVVVDDAVEAMVGFLKVHPIADGPEITSEMQVTGRLNAGEDSLF